MRARWALAASSIRGTTFLIFEFLYTNRARWLSKKKITAATVRIIHARRPFAEYVMLASFARRVGGRMIDIAQALCNYP
jgi:hypothetical protein